SPASRHPAHQQRPSLSPSGPRLPRPLSQPASGKHDWRRRTLPLGLRCRYLVSPSSPRPPPLEILPFQHLFRRRRSVLPQPIDCLDGGKLFVESCFLLIASTSLLRWRHSRRKAAGLRRAAAL